MSSLIAREGYTIIAGVLCSAAGLFVCSLLAGGSFAAVLRILAALTFVFFIFCLFFFRNPERYFEYDSNVLLCPADGTVVAIQNVHEQKYLKNNVKRISVFMSVFNVHVNRSPVQGSIEYLKYNPGKFINAMEDKASEDNESLFAGIQCLDRPEKIAVNFIAGLIARRIVFYKKLHDTVRQGERINIIKFGSRVDLYCPDTVDIKVKVGDKVRAGETVMAVFTN